ncbi:MAG: 4Fe-4S binding protein [Anaerolineales bacterium]|nr:4Fe-4S binding protein [Anaerolineales bacterium]
MPDPPMTLCVGCSLCTEACRLQAIRVM